MGRILYTVFIGILEVVLLSISAWAECPAKVYANLPMAKTPSHHYVVSVRIDGKPFNFLIDTGSPVTFITKHAAETAGLRLQTVNRDLFVTASGDSSRTIATGELAIASFRADAMELPVISTLGESEDGLLGADILGHFDVELDFKNSILSLYPQSQCGSVPWASQSVPSSVVFHFEAGHLVFDLDLDGKVYNAHLDTGAPRAYIELETAQRLFGLNKNDPNEMRRRDGNHPEHPSFYHVFERARLGSLTIPNVEILLVSKEVATVNMQEPWLSFGLSLLKHYHVFIAYKEKKLYLSKEAESPGD